MLEKTIKPRERISVEELSELLDPLLHNRGHQLIGIPMPKIQSGVVEPLLARYQPPGNGERLRETILKATDRYLADNGWYSEEKFSIPIYFMRD